MSQRAAVKRASIVVRYDGQSYRRDLAKCRRMLLQREIEGDFDDTAEFAALAGLNPSTVHRWLNGAGPGAKATTVRILAGLRLDFNDVHARVDPTSAEDGPVTIP